MPLGGNFLTKRVHKVFVEHGHIQYGNPSNPNPVQRREQMGMRCRNVP